MSPPSRPAAAAPLAERHVTLGDLDVAYLTPTDSPQEGPLAICLHGFPDSAWTWRYLLPELAAAGFRPVAPFLRGYAPTAVPADGLYQVGALSKDAIDLRDALGGDASSVIVGHDWGAMATYGATGFEPDGWNRAVTLAVPPAGVVAAAFTSYDQLRRSWYMYFFQHPLAEHVVGQDDLHFIDRLWDEWSPGYPAAEDLATTKAALRDPANLAAALGYYRATLGNGPTDDGLAGIEAAWTTPNPVPTLYLHGRADGCIGAELVVDVEQYLPGEGSAVEVIDGVGHFLHLEQPGPITSRIVGFLQEGRT